MNLKERIKNYLSLRNEWVSKEQIVEVAKEAFKKEGKGITSDYIGRCLRSLAESEEIAVSYYKSAKGKDIARYASIGTEEPKKKPTFNIIIKNGVPVAVAQ